MPDFAERWASRLTGAAGTVLTAYALALLVLHVDVLLVARWGGVLALMALVAASLPGPRTVVIIAVYIVASAVVCIPHLRWRRAVAARTTSPSGSTHPQGVRS